jgi:hypothetical protein
MSEIIDTIKGTVWMIFHPRKTLDAVILICLTSMMRTEEDAEYVAQLWAKFIKEK